MIWIQVQRACPTRTARIMYIQIYVPTVGIAGMVRKRACKSMSSSSSDATSVIYAFTLSWLTRNFNFEIFCMQQFVIVIYLDFMNWVFHWNIKRRVPLHWRCTIRMRLARTLPFFIKEWSLRGWTDISWWKFQL